MYFPIISEISRKRKKAKMLEIKKNEIIKKEYLALKDKIEKSCKEHNSGEYGRVEKRNKICPKCGSNLVNDRIRRVEGEIKGSVSGSFIFGTGGLYGSTSGTIDTNEVNKCNSCGNEWKKETTNYRYENKTLENKFSNLYWEAESYQKALNAKIDPDDLDEKFSSNEEKRKYQIDRVLNGYTIKELREFFGNTSIETLWRIAKTEIWKYYSDEYSKNKFFEYCTAKTLEKFGFNHINLD